MSTLSIQLALSSVAQLALACFQFKHYLFLNIHGGDVRLVGWQVGRGVGVVWDGRSPISYMMLVLRSIIFSKSVLNNTANCLSHSQLIVSKVTLLRVDSNSYSFKHIYIKLECFNERLGDYWHLYFDLGL